MTIEDEIKKLNEEGALCWISSFLKDGKFKQLDAYLSLAEAVQDRQYNEIRDYARSYAVIRGE